MEDEQSEAGSPSARRATVSNLQSADQSAQGSTLGADVQAKIGQHLRAMYDDVVRQGVPDRFLDLLLQLDGANGREAAPERDEEIER